MSHTNSTTNYGLPQFLTGDKPAWLTDVNNAYSDIDKAIYAAQSKADTAFTDAGNAQTDATTAINNAAAADAKGSGAIASIEAAFDPTTIYAVGAKVMYNSLLYRCIAAVVTPGPWTGSSNWERITVDNLITASDSKIGQLTSLSTTDKTSLVNAVNEVNGSLANTVKRYATNWGTSCQTTDGRNQFLVLRGYKPYVVWLASTNDINVLNIANNTNLAGTGMVTFDNMVFTRLFNNNLKVELPANDAITIFG